MTDDTVIRKLMYGDDKKEGKPKVEAKNLKINESQKVVVIESGGVRHQLPSVRLVEELVRENARLKNELVQTKTDIKKLTEAIKKMDNVIRHIERELATKADIYGE